MVFAQSAGDFAAEQIPCSSWVGAGGPRKNFTIEIDRSFSEVIRACANDATPGSIQRSLRATNDFIELGHAHSVEAWSESKLAGGLYGVAIGGAFFGESMFHYQTDASKIALLGLVEHLRARKFVFSTPNG